MTTNNPAPAGDNQTSQSSLYFQQPNQEMVELLGDELHGIMRFVAQSFQGTPPPSRMGEGDSSQKPIKLGSRNQMLWVARNKIVGKSAKNIYFGIGGSVAEISGKDGYARLLNTGTPLDKRPLHEITYAFMRRELLPRVERKDSGITHGLNVAHDPIIQSSDIIKQLAVMLNVSEVGRNHSAILSNAALMDLALQQPLDSTGFWSARLDDSREGSHPMTGGGTVGMVRDDKLGGKHGTTVYDREIALMTEWLHKQGKKGQLPLPIFTRDELEFDTFKGKKVVLPPTRLSAPFALKGAAGSGIKNTIAYQLTDLTSRYLK